MEEYPFIYIASIMRTGSTLIQEIFTDIPDSYIFHEPRLSDNMFNVKDKLIKDLPIDVKKLLGNNPSVETFANKVYPELKKHYKQIGIKETENTNWKEYVKYFPNIKIILTARNPKDLYHSIYEWCHKGDLEKPIKELPFSFENVCKVVNRELQIQKDILQTGNAILITYEKLCKHPIETIEIMKKWIDSPMENYGKIGSFLSNYDKRKNEHEEHLGLITENSIDTWKHLDSKMIDNIERFDREMGEYKKFWGYK